MRPRLWAKAAIGSGALLTASLLTFATADAAVITTQLNGGAAIVVPPSASFSPGVTFSDNGSNQALYEFVLGSALTLTASSFTNTAVAGTGIFDFSSIALYDGLGTAGSLLEPGYIGARLFGTETAGLSEYALAPGTYTIAYDGTVSGGPASVGSSISFAAAPVPEPATWAMMIVGIGMVGSTMRRSMSARAARALPA